MISVVVASCRDFIPNYSLSQATCVSSENEPVSLHFNNCHEIGHYGVVTANQHKFRKTIYDCRNDLHIEYGLDAMPFKPVVATDPVRIETTCLDLSDQANVTQVPDVRPTPVEVDNIQPVHSINAELLPPLDNTDSSADEADFQHLRALPKLNGTSGFVSPIDLSPLPEGKRLSGVSTLFGLSTGFLSDTLSTNTVPSTSSCTIIGKFGNANNCSTYNHCYGFGRGQLGIICPRDFAFDPQIKQCTLNWASCSLIGRCTTNGQLIADPTDTTRFFICIQNRNSLFATTYAKQWMVYRRTCPANQTFNPTTLACQTTVP